MKRYYLCLCVLLCSTSVWAQNFAKQTPKADSIQDEVRAALDAVDQSSTVPAVQATVQAPVEPSVKVEPTPVAVAVQEPVVPAPQAATPAVSETVKLPTDLKASGVDWAERYKDQPYVALVNEYQTTVKPDWSYEETYHARIKIQKDEAKDLGKWPIYYNKSRDAVIDIKAHVENPDGRQYSTVNVEDLPVYDDAPMYQDLRMKVISLEQVGVGSIIEVTVRSTTTHKEIPNQFWGEILYPAIPTKRASHTFIIPDDKQLELKSYRVDYKPLVEKSDGKTKYTFAFEETAPLPVDEELMPPLQDVLGAMYLSTMHDWKDVADWYRELVRKSTIDDSEITVRTLGLIKGKKSQQEKARAILEFLQDNFRMIPVTFGDNTVEPHPSTEILKNRYADSKDLALLAKQMLKLAGIDANTCLYSNEYAGDPQHGLPSPSVFSSVLLQVHLDNKVYYVDPALKGYDFGHLPSSYDNATLLIIGDTEYAFDHIPVGSPDEHAMISKADVTMNPDGSAEYRVHIKLPAETSQSFKKSWAGYTDQEKDQFFLNLEKNFAKDGKIIDRQIIGLDDRYAQIEFEFRYQAVAAYPVVNDMILIKEEDQADLPEFVTPSRVYPIFLPNNSLIKNTNTYHLPDGFKVGTLPPSYSLSLEIMDASVTYQQKDQIVQVDSTYATKRCSIPIERYTQVKDFRKELAKKSEQYIILKRSSDLSPEAKSFMNK